MKCSEVLGCASRARLGLGTQCVRLRHGLEPCQFRYLDSGLGEQWPPTLNEVSILLANVADPAVQPKQTGANRLHAAVQQERVPSDQIDQTVPRKPHNRYTILLEAKDVRPLFLEPVSRRF